MNERRKSVLAAAAVALAVLAADQVSKWAARMDVQVGERLHPLPLVSIVHVRNTGVAFGALGGQRWLVPVLTLLALALVVVWFASAPTRPGAWIVAGLIVGGALGNLLDRWRHGAVTDFISVPNWPAFNVADIAITIGVIALIVVAERDARRRNQDRS